MDTELSTRFEPWPLLRVSDWEPTRDTLHRWMQVVGKIGLALTPPINHFWHVAMHLSARGIHTPPIPLGGRTFDLTFDLLEHNLVLQISDGRRHQVPLYARSVADFHRELIGLLRVMGIDVHIWPHPVEMQGEQPPLDQDEEHAAYDPAAATRFFQVLSQTDQLMRLFMGRFQGKQSPSHFFWGSFDLAQTRFSGRRAPLPTDADRLRRESYSHEVASFGFWPGISGVSDAVFYAYAVPEPHGFQDAKVEPPHARYHRKLGEFILPYDDIQEDPSPGAEVLQFFQTVYEAAADLGHWDRAQLERAAIRYEVEAAFGPAPATSPDSAQPAH